MAVYVDDIFDYGNKGKWCHMMTDGDLSELHDMAQRIGLKRSWFQPKSSPHYDLTPNKRRLAIQHGTIPTKAQDMFKRCVLAKRQPAE
jgi:hypothetical protein